MFGRRDGRVDGMVLWGGATTLNMRLIHTPNRKGDGHGSKT